MKMIINFKLLFIKLNLLKVFNKKMIRKITLIKKIIYIKNKTKDLSNL